MSAKKRIIEKSEEKLKQLRFDYDKINESLDEVSTWIGKIYQGEIPDPEGLLKMYWRGMEQRYVQKSLAAYHEIKKYEREFEKIINRYN